MMTRFLTYALIASAGIALILGAVRYRVLSSRRKNAERAWQRLQQQIEREAKISEDASSSPCFSEFFESHQFQSGTRLELRADHHQLIQARQKVEFAADYYNSMADHYNAGIQAEGQRWVVRLGRFDSMQRYEDPLHEPEIIQDP